MILFAAAAFVCAPVAVHDGDTIRCAGVPVRLARIDAPELPGSPKCRRRSADCRAGAASAARQQLRRLIGSDRVTCAPVAADPRQGSNTRDRYGRTVAFCSAGGGDLSAAMIHSGHATPWPNVQSGNE